MPDTMAGNISKGRIIRLLDAVLYTGENVEATITALGNANPRLSIVFTNAVNAALANSNSHLSGLNNSAVSPRNYNSLHIKEKQHIDKHWFGGAHKNDPQGKKGRSYWPGIQSPQITVREAYLAALKLGTDNAGVITRPIATYWLCAGTHFEVVVCADRTEQITVMLLTPSIAWRYIGARRGLAGGSVVNADNPDASLTEGENIHVFAELSRIEQVASEANMPVLRRPLPQRRDKQISPDQARLISGGNMSGQVRRYQVLGDKDEFTT